MTIKEIFHNQQTDERTIYLLQQGMFYHAYNEAAEFFHQLMGYKLRSLYLPHGDTYSLVGFPLSSLDKVISKLIKSTPNASIMVKDSCITIRL